MTSTTPRAMLTVISSMATRAVLAELADGFNATDGSANATLTSVGGVDAARRVAAGEAFDLVVLAADAIARLANAGHVRADTVAPLVHSGVSVAVRDGTPPPDLGTEAAVRAAVLAAPSIGYSTGPSGTALLALFDRWGLSDALRGRLVQAPAGVPVGSMVASGAVALGFQQTSELIHQPGITIAGPLPAAIAIDTVFSAAITTACGQPAAAQRLIDHLRAPSADAAKRRQGMAPA